MKNKTNTRYRIKRFDRKTSDESNLLYNIIINSTYCDVR